MQTQTPPTQITNPLIALGDALSAYYRQPSFDTTDEPRVVIREYNRLFDAAIAAGMSRDHADLEGWAANRVTEWLLSAPLVWSGIFGFTYSVLLARAAAACGRADEASLHILRAKAARDVELYRRHVDAARIFEVAA